MFQKNGGQEAQVKDRVKRVALVMGQVWRIGKRRFSGDWERRLWLFDRLIWTVMGYGVEIWDWEERDNTEMVGKKYLRLVMGGDGITPGYLIREELQRKKIMSRTGRRAWEYKKRLEEKRRRELARLC